MPRPRLHATAAERQRAYRQHKRRTAVAPDVVCRTLGACTLYCSDWQKVYDLLPRGAAVVTDPPYKVGTRGYDVTRARRRPSQWATNFAGHDQDFDPTPWLRFPEVILFGADQYRDRRPRGGSWICGDKLAGTPPADFAPGEWAWTSRDIPPQFFPHLWRGGMRAGEENVSRLQEKYHPAQKPVAVMRFPVPLEKFLTISVSGSFTSMPVSFISAANALMRRCLLR